MPYKVRWDSDLGIIESTITGELSGDEVRGCTDEIIDLSTRHDVEAFLIDALSLASVSSTMDVYDVPNRYEDGGLSLSSRFALVLPELRAAHKIAHFYDDVCNNRGWTVQPFATRDEAVTWLTGAAQKPLPG